MIEANRDLDRVAPLVLDFYLWLADQGGAPPDELLQADLTPAQRRMLLDYCDDVLVVWGETATLRANQ
jgi:hypothetical protein